MNRGAGDSLCSLASHNTLAYVAPSVWLRPGSGMVDGRRNNRGRVSESKSGSSDPVCRVVDLRWMRRMPLRRDVFLLPINSRILAFYNVERPEAAPDWAVPFTIQLLFPK